MRDGKRADGGARINSDAVDMPLMARHEFHQNAHGRSLAQRRERSLGVFALVWLAAAVRAGAGQEFPFS